jgi:hypothetical protein
LNQKKPGVPRRRPALGNVGQAFYLLKHFHYFHFSGHISVLAEVTAVRVPAIHIGKIQIPLGSIGAF